MVAVVSTAAVAGQHGAGQLSLATAVAGRIGAAAPQLKQLLVSTAVYGAANNSTSSSMVSNSSGSGGMLVAKAVTSSLSASRLVREDEGRNLYHLQ